MQMTERNNLPRMRTIKKAIEAIRAEDPDTDFTEHRLRKLIKTGEIPHIERGQRFLVDLNRLYAYLGSELPAEPPQNMATRSVIRKIG